MILISMKKNNHGNQKNEENHSSDRIMVGNAPLLPTYELFFMNWIIAEISWKVRQIDFAVFLILDILRMLCLASGHETNF